MSVIIGIDDAVSVQGKVPGTGANNLIYADANNSIGMGVSANSAIKLAVNQTGKVYGIRNYVDGGAIVTMSSAVGAGYIGTISSDPLVVLTGEQERMRIADNGNVLIGGVTDSYNAKIREQLSAGQTKYFMASTRDWVQASQGSGFEIVATGETGNVDVKMQAFNQGFNGFANIQLNPAGGNVLVGTGTDNGANNLQVNGSINTNSYLGFGDNNALIYRAGEALRLRTNTIDRVEITSGGYTKLGADAGAPGVKMKELTGTTGANQGDSVGVAHGLNVSKIISITAKVYDTALTSITPGFDSGPGYNFGLVDNTATAVIYNTSGNSVNILSKPFVITIWYKE